MDSVQGDEAMTSIETHRQVEARYLVRPGWQRGATKLGNLGWTNPEKICLQI
jgi:hypothetical protein